jgi:NCS1 family nucleobase:cation symporter-1
MSDAHNIGDYTFAGGLFAIGMSPFQITLGILGEALIIFAGCTFSGFIGHKTGGRSRWCSGSAGGCSGRTCPH